MTDFLGYFRDFVVAVLGFALLLDWEWLTQERAGGLLLVVTTGAALGAHIYQKTRK